MIVVFILSALWWIRGLWKLPDGKDWLRGLLGLVLMGVAILSKTLIQFSVDGQGCAPSLLFAWGQTMVEVMKINLLLQKVSCVGVLHAPDPATGHHQPTPPPKTPGHPWQVRLSLLSGHSSFYLGLGAHKSLFVPSKSLFPQPCVK